MQKLRITRSPLTGEQNCAYLVKVWERETMTTFKDFLRWYNNKDAIPTLEAVQKMIDFYHNIGIDMLKLGCTLPKLANFAYISLLVPNSTPLLKRTKEKIREDMVGGPSIVFTRRAVVDETFIHKSQNVCKSIVGIDASQLYPFSMCQSMPTGLSTRYEYDSDSQRFKPRQNKTRSFENMVMSSFQRLRPECKIESNITTGTQKKSYCFSADGFCSHYSTVIEAMGCYYHYCPCQETRPSLSDKEVERGNKRREMDEMRRDYIRGKGYKIVEMWECEWWRLYKTEPLVKQHLRDMFP